MPGLAGVIAQHKDRRYESELAAMMGTLAPDENSSCGTYIKDPLGLWVVWSGRRDNPADCRQIWNEKGDVCLFFIGETFIEGSELVNLRRGSHEFDHDDASYLVHMYEEHGEGFLAALNGWFSGLLVDVREQKIILFNDRYALQRMYVHEFEGTVYFASDAKCLLKILPKLRRIDPLSLAEFSSCGCPLQNRTLFSGISLLPGASRWIRSGGSPLRKETYFQKNSWEEQPPLGQVEYETRLREVLGRILPKYCRSVQPVAMSLTGGLDGRMIMALGRFHSGEMPCYTFGGSFRDCTDVVAARSIARACDQPHTIISIGEEFLREFPALASKAVVVSDGAMDVTGAVELYANRAAKEIAPVRLTGNYGSEILRQSIAFKPRPLREDVYSAEFVKLGKEAGAVYASEIEGKRLSFIAFKQTAWYHCARLKLEQSELTVRSPYLDNELVALAYRAPADQISSSLPLLRLVAEANPTLARIPTDRGAVYPTRPVISKLQKLLGYVTSRAEYAYDYGMPDWLAKVDRRLPMERFFLGHHKFYHFRTWYRNALSSYVREVLCDPSSQSRSHIRPRCLERIVSDHIRGIRNYTSELHRLLSIELVYRELTN